MNPRRRRPAQPWRGPFLPLFLLAAVVVVVVTAARPAHGQVSAPYRGPDLTTPVFDPGRTGFDPTTCRQVAALLAANVTHYDAVLDAKMLGVALRLDPNSRAAKEANERRRRGEFLPRAPRPPTADAAGAGASSYLAHLATGLSLKGGEDNATLAGFLMEIAAGLAPHDEGVHRLKDGFDRTHAPAVWSFLAPSSPSLPPTGETGPDTNTGAAATGAAWPVSLVRVKNQSKLHGLMVQDDPGSTERRGSAQEIILTAEDEWPGAPTTCRFTTEAGRSLQIALAESYRAVRLRHPRMDRGNRFTFSFADKYTPVDGPSASTVLALLLYSLYDPAPLAEDCAITGDLTVDGRVRKVGGVPAKIRGAMLDRCRCVGVPRENAEDVDDLALLFPANTLWKIQVFTVDTLDAAFALARADRAADLRRAMDLFSQIQGAVGLETPRLTAAHRTLIPQLEEVLRLAPNHASADWMLRQLRGRTPGTLSLHSSLEELTRTLNWTLGRALPSRERPTLDPRPVGEGLQRLTVVTPLLDYRVADLRVAGEELLRTMQQIDPGHPSADAYAAAQRRYRALSEVQERMASDRALTEALSR